MRQQFSVATAVMCLALMACGCQTTSPRAQPPVGTSSQGGASAQGKGRSPEDASTTIKPAQGSSQGAGATHAASVVIEVTPELLIIDGTEILSLSDGFVPSNGFESQRYFSIRGVVEPVEEALVAERRRRVVYGEDPAVQRVLVKVDPKVPADTILGLQYTLAATDARWLTLQIGEQEPLDMPLSADFIGARSVSWRARAGRPSTVGRHEKSSSQKPTNNNTMILGALTGSGSAEGFGGLGVRGIDLGKGRPMRSSGATTAPPPTSARYCDASADSPAKPLALTHATVKIFPTRVSTWLAEHHRGHRKFMFEEIEVDGEYAWWKVHNALAQMRSHFGEAQTLLIWPHPSLGSDIVAAVTTVNCELPKSSYASKEAWREARDELSECEPLFPTQLLANGKHPAKDH